LPKHFLTKLDFLQKEIAIKKLCKEIYCQKKFQLKNFAKKNFAKKKFLRFFFLKGYLGFKYNLHIIFEAEIWHKNKINQAGFWMFFLVLFGWFGFPQHYCCLGGPGLGWNRLNKK